MSKLSCKIKGKAKSVWFLVRLKTFSTAHAFCSIGKNADKYKNASKDEMSKVLRDYKALWSLYYSLKELGKLQKQYEEIFS